MPVKSVTPVHTASHYHYHQHLTQTSNTIKLLVANLYMYHSQLRNFAIKYSSDLQCHILPAVQSTALLTYLIIDNSSAVADQPRHDRSMIFWNVLTRKTTKVSQHMLQMHKLVFNVFKINFLFVSCLDLKWPWMITHQVSLCCMLCWLDIVLHYIQFQILSSSGRTLRHTGNFVIIFQSRTNLVLYSGTLSTRLLREMCILPHKLQQHSACNTPGNWCVTLLVGLFAPAPPSLYYVVQSVLEIRERRLPALFRYSAKFHHAVI